MLAVVVEVPDADGFAAAPAAVGGRVGRTPLADAPLLLGRNDAQVLLDDPLVEVGHPLVFGLGQLFGLDGAAPTVGAAHVAHVHLRDSAELAALGDDLEHLGDVLLDVVEYLVALEAADVHLCADAVDVGHAVGLPLIDPADQALHLLVVVPVGLQVVVVDEELHVLWAVLACQPAGLTHVFEVAHVVLPVEGVAADVPRAAVVAIGVLQQVVAVAVVTVAGDGLVNEVPGLDLTVTGFHHTLDPEVHGVDKCVVALLLRLGDGLTLVALKLDGLDVDVTHEVAALEHEEAVLHECLILDLNVLPLGGEGYVGVFSVAPVAQLAVELSVGRSADGHRHLVGLSQLDGYVFHRQELHVPGVVTLLGGVDDESVGRVEVEGEAVNRLVRCPAYGLVLAEVLAGNLGPCLLRRGVWSVGQ